MATAPVYASIPLAPILSALATANANLDGTGTLVEIAAGTTDGIVVERVTARASGSTTAGLIRFFISIDGGTTKRLWHSVSVDARTPSATASSWSAAIDFLRGVLLKDANTKLYACPTKSETFNVIVERAGL